MDKEWIVNMINESHAIWCNCAAPPDLRIDTRCKYRREELLKELNEKFLGDGKNGY